MLSIYLKGPKSLLPGAVSLKRRQKEALDTTNNRDNRSVLHRRPLFASYLN